MTGEPATTSLRTRPLALDELLIPAGFEPVIWEQVTLGLSGNPEQIWQLVIQKYYETTLLDNEQLNALHDQFIASASARQLPTGHRISIATTRLAA
ncbi:hypothetical protein [Nocardia crassostreae]|uniref:hypothetical protein n=1 Tax=Nocardia crassostreae TaxID=53428 RepID=UPI000836BED9|nr:hypothetical protein [Nocardia crassostreae]